MAKDALGDGLATATATDVLPWYADDGGLKGYVVLIRLASPQDITATDPVPGTPGPYWNVTSVWISLSPTGEAMGVSVQDGTLSPDVQLPIVDSASLGE
jgi:hypothetical protein